MPCLQVWCRTDGWRSCLSQRWSSCTPVVVLLVEFQIDECLGGYHTRQGADPSRQQVEQLVVVLADDLDDQVKAAGRGDDVIHLGHRGQAIGDEIQLALCLLYTSPSPRDGLLAR